MIEIIKSILSEKGIDRIGIIPLDECEIINQRILPPQAKSVVIFCIPYRSDEEFSSDGFSEYARIYDYHKFASALYGQTIQSMESSTGYSFWGFCDHSPINEKLGAAKCGLGVIGRNSLFIDNIYGSFVFLGSIFTDIPCDGPIHEVKHCVDCGKCVSACPNNAIADYGIDRVKCLSAASQKKNKSQEEKELLKMHNIIWGCDKCQIVCPYNIKAKVSPIPYFKNTRIKHIDKNYILSLSDDEFNKYAFSYKGRQIVLDNIDFI